MAKFFNTNIKFLRKRKKLSQEDVAEGSGIERSILSRIENNKIDTSIDNAVKLSTYFGIPIDILIGKDLRLEENVILDENHKLDLLIMDKTKELSEEDKKKVANIIDIVISKEK